MSDNSFPTHEGGLSWENVKTIEAMWEKVKEAGGPTLVPRLLIGGKTGVGKSSLLNALLGSNIFETGVIPTTRPDGDNEKIWTSEMGSFKVFDTPGFADAADDQRYEEDLRKLLATEAHIFLLVLKADDRALEVEKRWIERAQKYDLFNKVATICVVNQIDKVNPLRDWEPKSLNLEYPNTEKERNICRYIEYVSSVSAFTRFQDMGRMVPVASGESAKDPSQYGVEALKAKIYEQLPDAAKTEFARHANLRVIEGKRLIKWFSSSAAAAVAANVFPASDALIIAPIQVAMIVKLGHLHGIHVSAATASGILASAGLSFAGRFMFQQLISLFPGIKNLVGPPMAFSLTYSLGLSINELFSRGKTEATKMEWEALAEKNKDEANSEAEKTLVK